MPPWRRRATASTSAGSTACSWRRRPSPISAATISTTTPTSTPISPPRCGCSTTLLPKGAPAVIFADDRWSGRAIEVATSVGAKVLTVGRSGDFLTLKRLEHERQRQIAEIEAEGRIHGVVLPLAGEFQMANALVAAGMAIATGVRPRTRWRRSSS